MALSSIDIRKQEFGKRFLAGLNPKEVNDYLATLAREVDLYHDKLRAAHEQIERLKGDLDHYQKVEEALQEALVTARENARRTQQNAEQKAELILRDAEAKARRITEGSEMQAQKIVQEAEHMRSLGRLEVSKLTEKRAELILRLRAFLSGEIQVLDMIERDDLAALNEFSRATPIATEATSIEAVSHSNKPLSNAVGGDVASANDEPAITSEPANISEPEFDDNAVPPPLPRSPVGTVVFDDIDDFPEVIANQLAGDESGPQFFARDKEVAAQQSAQRADEVFGSSDDNVPQRDASPPAAKRVEKMTEVEKIQRILDELQ